MKVLVTGASGFIGRGLCRALKDAGHHVTAFLRNESEGPWDAVLLGELPAPVDPARLQEIDGVFHLAGKAHAVADSSADAEEYARVNTEGTRVLLEACREAGCVRRFVYFSSVKAMPAPGDRCVDESFGGPTDTPYGESKRRAEVLLLSGGYLPEPVVLRPAMVYGLTHRGNLPRMIDAIARHRFPPLPEFGNRRSMVHQADVIDAALLAATRPEAVGNTYIVTDGEACSTRELYDLICRALGRRPPRLRVPSFVLGGLALMGDGVGRLSGRRFVFDSVAYGKLKGSACYDASKIGAELGFAPKHDLARAIPEIVHYLVNP